MSTIEEITKLKALLNQGAITEEEFKTLSQKLEPERNKKEEEPKNTVITETSFQPASDVKITGNLTRVPENVVTAGESIQSAIGFQVASYICNFIGIIILVVSFFKGVSSIMRGVGDFLGDNPSFIFALIFFLLGFIFWVTSLTKFNKAGEFLKKSEAVYYGRNTIRIEPSKQKIESQGLKIGQEFAGGIIAYFDESGKYVGVVAKSDLPEKMNLQQAILACEKYEYEGYNDWFLPDRHEWIEVYKKLYEKQLGNFKNEKYWINYNVHDNVISDSYQETDMNLVRPMRLIRIQ